LLERAPMAPDSQSRHELFVACRRFALLN